MANSNGGTLKTFLELISEYKRGIVIPIVQRDYAQGRANSEEAEKVRDGILSTLQNAIHSKKTACLDYIYGSVPEGNEKFLPIDGQQRLTTLLLLHIYLAVKEGRFDELQDSISDKFTYEVRDSAEEFVRNLCKYAFPKSDSKKPKELIENECWFHLTYNDDPSVAAMLNMLDAIHDKFHDISGFDTLKNGAVKFWVLELENFGLTDDLFIKMNSRGMNLSPYDNFKSEFEQHLDKLFCQKNYSLINWKNKIDNEWLDYFWKRFGDGRDENDSVSATSSEQALFRHILFFARILCDTSREDPYLEYRDIKKTSYTKDIELLSQPENFQFLIYTLDNIDIVLTDKHTNALWEKAVNDNSFRQLSFQESALLFARFYYSYISYIIHDTHDTANINSENFWHVYSNLLAGQRETNSRDKQYSSSIDGVRIGAFILYTKQLIEAVKQVGDVYLVLSSQTPKLGFSYFDYEVEKARYVVNSSGAILACRKNEIWELEAVSGFNGLIHNLLDNGKPVISAALVSNVLNVDQTLLLRAIQSFSDEWLAEKSFHGDWKLVVLPGKDEHVSWYKYYCGFNNSPANCGEYLMTMPSKGKTHITDAIRAFWKWISQQKNINNLPDLLIKIVTANIKQKKPSGLAYYFAKYPEFWGASDSDCFVGLIPKDETLLSQLRVFNTRDDGRNAWVDEYKHYNPFYAALKTALSNHNQISLSHSKRGGYGNKHELDFTLVVEPIGITAELQGKPGEFKWIIDKSQATPYYTCKIDESIPAFRMTPQNGFLTLECNGEDCIEFMARWLRFIVPYVLPAGK
jgi:hypothetical protein